MERAITGFSLDQVGDWVAQLACGHRQHVRHRPPFQPRPWVTSLAGRRSRLGTPLECRLCDRAEIAEDPGGADDGGDPACWAGLLCPDCGVVLDGGPHRPPCTDG